MSRKSAVFDSILTRSELKNKDGNCPDFVSSTPGSHSCANCEYRVRETGTERYLETVEDMHRSLRNISYNPDNPSCFDQNLARLEAWQRKNYTERALETRSVYFNKGEFSYPPTWFSYCSAFSKRGKYVVCFYQNRHGTCHLWKKK